MFSIGGDIYRPYVLFSEMTSVTMLLSSSIQLQIACQYVEWSVGINHDIWVTRALKYAYLIYMYCLDKSGHQLTKRERTITCAWNGDWLIDWFEKDPKFDLSSSSEYAVEIILEMMLSQLSLRWIGPRDGQLCRIVAGGMQVIMARLDFLFSFKASFYELGG